MDRLKEVRSAIDVIVHQQTNVRYRHGAYIDLYGVSVNCALLALKRGLDVQMAQVAGMLHDLSTYQRADGTDHDRLSAQAARRLLGDGWKSAGKRQNVVRSPTQVVTRCIIEPHEKWNRAVFQEQCAGAVERPKDAE